MRLPLAELRIRHPLKRNRLMIDRIRSLGNIKMDSDSVQEKSDRERNADLNIKNSLIPEKQGRSVHKSKVNEKKERDRKAKIKYATE